MLPETFYQWLTWLVSGFGIYLFREQQSHEKRIQKIEDVNNLEIANLKNDIVDLEAKMDEGFKDLKQQIVTLSNNVYKSKNDENQLSTAISALINILSKETPA